MSQPTNNQGSQLPFLLEIGSEEIPARFIPAAMSYLEEAVQRELTAHHLTFGSLRVVATPRRMALLIEGLLERQPDRTLEIKGPPVSVAFDAEGNPTPAGLGFARKAGLALEDCDRAKDKRGEYLQAVKTEPGRPAAEVLATFLPGVILGVPFRKTMRWGDHELDYARPLQWILALLGPETVPLQVDYLTAGNTTRGHRTLAGDDPVIVAEPGKYLETLRGLGVIADHEERRRIIAEGLNEAIARYDGEAALLEDEELLTEVTFLCEHPTPFLGSFGEEFLQLPAQVVTTAMKSHQRYFSVLDRGGEGLKPRFAAVRCGGAEHLDNVIAGNERVLRARLADALFYWEFDQKKSPDERTELLGAVTWLEGYGSVLDKTRRIAALAGWLWDNGLAGGDGERVTLERAAHLCKSDLVSEMIKDGKEFTKLEGFIGARYAELAGESPAVCQAIEQHFLPRSAAGRLPADRVSAVLSIADRLDNLAGCWLAGFVPTGAKDPYALRRHVLAILRILLEEKAHLNLEAALAQALAPFAAMTSPEAITEATAQVGEFVRTRLAGYFVDNLELQADVVRAVVPVRWRDPADAVDWVAALTHFRDREDFQLLATGFKRCRNILKGEILPLDDLDGCLQRWQSGGSGSEGEDFARMPEDEETTLREAVAAAAADLGPAEKAHDYDGVFSLLSHLGPAIDRYFEQVRVNVDDPELTRLRHAFLRETHGLFARYADFSEVVAAED